MLLHQTKADLPPSNFITSPWCFLWEIEFIRRALGNTCSQLHSQPFLPPLVSPEQLYSKSMN